MQCVVLQLQCTMNTHAVCSTSVTVHHEYSWSVQYSSYSAPWILLQCAVLQLQCTMNTQAVCSTPVTVHHQYSCSVQYFSYSAPWILMQCAVLQLQCTINTHAVCSTSVTVHHEYSCSVQYFSFSAPWILMQCAVLQLQCTMNTHAVCSTSVKVHHEYSCSVQYLKSPLRIILSKNIKIRANTIELRQSNLTWNNHKPQTYWIVLLNPIATDRYPVMWHDVPDCGRAAERALNTPQDHLWSIDNCCSHGPARDLLHHNHQHQHNCCSQSGVSTRLTTPQPSTPTQLLQ